jgi:hypothetical protein
VSLDSTPDLETALRTRLLTFAPLTGDTLPNTLGMTTGGAGVDGKLYWEAAPDNSGPRWGVLRLQNRRSEGDGAERELAELEVTLFARPRSQKVTLETCADLCDQAMLRYTEKTSLGLVGCWGRLRSTLPPFTSPADSEVVQIRTVYSLVIYPAYLTQYHDV